MTGKSQYTKERFEQAWLRYWYTNKPWSDRLVDDMGLENKVCREFFQALMETEETE